MVIAMKKMYQKKTKAQGITEYVLLSAAVIAAVLTMSIYVGRSKKGYLKKYSDTLGSQYSARKQKVNKMKHIRYIDNSGNITSDEDMYITKGRDVSNRGYKRTEFKKHMVAVTKDATPTVTTKTSSDIFGSGTIDSDVSALLTGVVSDISISDGTNVIEKSGDAAFSEENLMDQLQ